MPSKKTAALVLVAVLSGPTPCFAQSSPENKVAAEALFDTARQLIADGKFAEACPKLEQSQRLDPGIGMLLYLADCYERSGRLASAWATFREGASQAQAAGQSERAAAGEERARALEPRLSKLTVRVAADAAGIAGLEVRQSGAVLPKGLWEAPTPVDGGDHVVTATAPGYAPWSTKVHIGTEKDDVVVSVPMLQPKPEEAAPPPAPAPVAPPPVAPAAQPGPAPAPRDRGTGSGSQRTLAIVAGGVGVVGLGIGTYFGLRAISKNSDAKDLCDGAVCRDPRGVDLTDEAKSAATISNVAFGLGLTALTAGIVLYATAPSESGTSFRVSPNVGRRQAGVFVGGSFQ